MAQATSGVRSILSRPWVYDLWGGLLGASRARADFVANYLRIQQGDSVLDIGCGTGAIFEAMPCGVNYTGFDLSEAYIDEARARCGPGAKFVHARVGEEPEIEANSQVVCLATGVLHHLEDGEAETLFRLAWRVLRRGGRLVTVDGALTEKQSPIARWIISRDRGQNIRETDGYVRLARGVFNDVTWEIKHDWLRIPYTHLIMTCTKT